MTFVDPNIPALKYGGEMEINAVNEFQKMHAISHKNIKLKNVVCFSCQKNHSLDVAQTGFFLLLWQIMLEIKCPYSINYTSPTDHKVTLPYLLKGKDDKLALDKNHQYYMQCQMQMAVTGTNICHFLCGLLMAITMTK